MRPARALLQTASQQHQSCRHRWHTRNNVPSAPVTSMPEHPARSVAGAVHLLVHGRCRQSTCAATAAACQISRGWPLQLLLQCTCQSVLQVRQSMWLAVCFCWPLLQLLQLLVERGLNFCCAWRHQGLHHWHCLPRNRHIIGTSDAQADVLLLLETGSFARR